MRKVITTNITTNVGMPIKSGTIDQIQSAYIEAIDALVKNAIGTGYDPTKFYVFYGADNDNVAPDYQITAGALFFNGIIYLFDAATFTATGAQVAVGTITTSYVVATNADPVVFTDGNSNNVHEIKKIVWSAGDVDSGDVNFSDLIYVNIGKAHIIGTTGEPAFQNSFANQSISNITYFIQKKSIIQIIGLVKGTITNSVVIFTLPVGFRPSTPVYGSVNYVLASTGLVKAGLLTIAINGQVSLSSGTAGVSDAAEKISINISF